MIKRKLSVSFFLKKGAFSRRSCLFEEFLVYRLLNSDNKKGVSRLPGGTPNKTPVYQSENIRFLLKMMCGMDTGGNAAVPKGPET